MNTADIKRAVHESVIPSDSALAQAIAAPEKPSRKSFAKALNGPFKAVESNQFNRAAVEIGKRSNVTAVTAPNDAPGLVPA